MKSISSIAFLSASLATPSAADVTFTFTTSSCGSDPFTDFDVSIQCDGQHAPDCMFGDSATIDGTMTAQSNFTDMNLTVKACISSYCPDENSRVVATLCDWLVPDGNHTCGTVGPYNISATEEIPEADIPDWWSWLVTVGIAPDEVCEEEAQEETQSAQGSSYNPRVSFSIMGAVFGTAFGTMFAVRKKIICTNDEDEEVDLDNENPFIEMKDTVCNAVSV